MTRLLAFLAVLPLLLAAGLSPVAADAKCQPSGRGNDGSHYWTGSQNFPGQTVGGAYSQILNYSPWVEPGYSTFAYSMIRTSSGSGYAQVGWEEQSGGYRYTFVEWTHDLTWTRHEYYPQPTNNYTYYTVLWNSSYVFTFQVNGNTIETESAQFTPNAAEIMSEVQTSASQMPGGYNYNEDFFDRHIYINGWQSFGGNNYNSNANWYGTTWQDSATDYGWDWACSS